MILQEIAELMDYGVKEMGKTYQGLKICELGNQRMKWNSYRTGKNYLIAKGAVEHISIDLNGKDGALAIDLSKPIDKWKDYFDMVTNYGTMEHVTNGVYQCLFNIHNFTINGGAMIHAGPISEGCPWHSPYHFKPWFFEKLAEACGYKCIFSQVIVADEKNLKKPAIDRSLVCSVLMKSPSSIFLKEDDFYAIGGIDGLKKQD